MSESAKWNIYTVLAFQGRILVRNIHRATELSNRPSTHTIVYDTGSRMYLNSSSKRQLVLPSSESDDTNPGKGLEMFITTERVVLILSDGCIRVAENNSKKIIK